MTIRTAAQLAHQAAIAAERAPATIEWYEVRRLELARYWHEAAPLDSLTTEELQAWVDMRRPKVSPTTIHHLLRYVRRLFRVAMQAGWPGRDHTIGVRAPRMVLTRPETMTAEEVLGIIDRMRRTISVRTATRDADLVEALFRTGLRRSEAARAQVGDIDRKRLLLHVRGKNGARTIPLTERALEVLPAIVAVRTPEHVSLILKRWQRRLGEPRLHPHALRHSFATALIDRGVSVAQVARLLGHSPRSIAITQLYYGPGEESLRRAVALL